VTVWLSRATVLAIHEEQLVRYGGATGLRDAGLLESALARPHKHASCAEPDIAELAALYTLGIVRNPPFVAGNKRTGYAALETLLELNGALFPVSDADAVIAICKLAAGDTTDNEFIAWVRAHAALPP
jgi:death on curing protein